MLIAALLVSSVLGTDCPPVARRCTCARRTPRDTVAEVVTALNSSHALFIGTVVHAAQRTDSSQGLSVTGERRWFRYARRIATVVVTRRWAGTLPDTVLVETAAEGSMCGSDLTVGNAYLIDASRGSDSRLSTSSCSLTRPIGSARWIEEIFRRARSPG